MARPLGVRGHQKSSNLVASHKAGGELFVETMDESTTMLALDIDPRTRSITAQPFTIRLDLAQVFPTRSEAVRAEPRERAKRVDGTPHQERVYTPDFLVELVTPVPLVVEAKSAIEVARIGDVLARRRHVLHALGFNYLVVPSTQVDQPGLHSNLVHLRDALKYQRDNDTKALLHQLIDLIRNYSAPFALQEIKGKVPDLGIYLALVSGVIGCDLRSGNLGVNTMLWQTHGDLSHLQLLNLDV